MSRAKVLLVVFMFAAPLSAHASIIAKIKRLAKMDREEQRHSATVESLKKEADSLKQELRLHEERLGPKRQLERTEREFNRQFEAIEQLVDQTDATARFLHDSMGIRESNTHREETRTEAEAVRWDHAVPQTRTFLYEHEIVKGQAERVLPILERALGELRKGDASTTIEELKIERLKAKLGDVHQRAESLSRRLKAFRSSM